MDKYLYQQGFTFLYNEKCRNNIRFFLFLNLNCLKLMRAACEITYPQSLKYENPSHTPCQLLQSWSLGNRDIPDFRILFPLPLFYQWTPEPTCLGTAFTLSSGSACTAQCIGKNSLLSFTACFFPTRVNPGWAQVHGKGCRSKTFGSGRVWIIHQRQQKKPPGQ